MKTRDLGVMMTPDLNYTEQTREAVNKATRQTNFILRCFVLSDDDVCMRLFQTYVIPILTYCAPVWNPRFKKDKNLIQSVFNRFRRRTAHRCKNDYEKLPQMDAEMVFADIDQKMFARICKNSTFCDLLFDVMITKIGSMCVYRPVDRVSTQLPTKVYKSRFSLSRRCCAHEESLEPVLLQWNHHYLTEDDRLSSLGLVKEPNHVSVDATKRLLEERERDIIGLAELARARSERLTCTCTDVRSK